MNNVILKERAGVKKGAVKLLLAGHLPERDHLLRPELPEQRFALENFNWLMMSLNTKPKMHIAYMREGYENADNNAVRLTFDRAVESVPNPDGGLIARSHAAHRVFDPFLVLELKFTDRFRNWFRALVEKFDCTQCGATKFAEGIFTKGEDWAQNRRKKSADGLVDEFLAGTNFPKAAVPPVAN